MLNLFLLLRGLCHRAGGGEGGAREVDRGQRQGGGGDGVAEGHGLDGLLERALLPSTVSL